MGALAALAAMWLVFVLVLAALGRTADARDLAALLPDSIILFKRLLGDRRVPLHAKAVLGLLVLYLAMPFDLVPDFIPVAGQLDDAILVTVALGYVAGKAGPGVIEELWPGSRRGLQLLLRFARRSPPVDS